MGPYGQLPLSEAADDDPRERYRPKVPPLRIVPGPAARRPGWREPPDGYRIVFWRGPRSARDRLGKRAPTLEAARAIAEEGVRGEWEGAWIFEA